MLVCANKMSAFETKDGGVTWKSMPGLSEIKAAPEFTTFNAIAFIAGAHVPPRRNEVPEWMDAEKAQNRRLLPFTLILLQTMDGGGAR